MPGNKIVPYNNPASISLYDVYLGAAMLVAQGIVSVKQAYEGIQQAGVTGVSFAQSKVRRAVNQYRNLSPAKRLAVDVVAGSAVGYAGANPSTLASYLGALHDKDPLSIIKAAERTAFDYLSRNARNVIRRIPDGAKQIFAIMKDHNFKSMNPAAIGYSVGPSGREVTVYNPKRAFEHDLSAGEQAAKRLALAKVLPLRGEALHEDVVEGSAMDWELAKQIGVAKGQIYTGYYPNPIWVPYETWNNFKKKWSAMEAESIRKGAYRRRVNRYLAGLSKYY